MKREDLRLFELVNVEIQTIKEQIDRLESVKITSIISDIPKSQDMFDIMGECLVKKEELHLLYLDKLNVLLELQLKIEKWLESVPNRDTRIFFRLKYLEGKTYEEIAEYMNIHTTTVWRWDKKICNSLQVID